MKLVIFGANGPVGKLLTQQALNEGYLVTAVTRHPNEFAMRSEQLRVVAGDVFDETQTRNAIEGQDAVISTFGVPYTLKPVTVYSKGVTNILAGMRAARTNRLVAVTSGGTNPKLDLSEGLFWSLVLKPFIGRTLYSDMRRMEQIVFASDVDWTVVRPSRLVDTPSITPYEYAEGYVVRGITTTSRRDLADFLLKQARSHVLVRKAVALASQV